MTESDRKPSLEDLEARVDKARAAHEARPGGGSRSGDGPRRENVGVGLRIALDLVAGVVVGTALGWGLDRWLGTKPWFLIVGFMVGSAAGFMSVVRIAQAEDRARRERQSKGDGRK